jgi:hypothetical protein
MAKVNLSTMGVQSLMDLRKRVDERLRECRAEMEKQLDVRHLLFPRTAGDEYRRGGGGKMKSEHQPHATPQTSDVTIFRASRINDLSRRRCSLASADAQEGCGRQHLVNLPPAARAFMEPSRSFILLAIASVV